MLVIGGHDRDWKSAGRPTDCSLGGSRFWYVEDVGQKRFNGGPRVHLLIVEGGGWMRRLSGPRRYRRSGVDGMQTAHREAQKMSPSSKASDSARQWGFEVVVKETFRLKGTTRSDRRQHRLLTKLEDARATGVQPPDAAEYNQRKAPPKLDRCASNVAKSQRVLQRIDRGFKGGRGLNERAAGGGGLAAGNT